MKQDYMCTAIHEITNFTQEYEKKFAWNIHGCRELHNISEKAYIYNFFFYVVWWDVSKEKVT